jgi:hypothetical protein
MLLGKLTRNLERIEIGKIKPEGQSVKTETLLNWILGILVYIAIIETAGFLK